MRSSGVGLLLPLDVVRKINSKTVLENITVHKLRCILMKSVYHFAQTGSVQRCL